eukprot:683598-Ditylum_brightwellii.AAC.1
MYGLKQAAILAYNQLAQHLEKHSYLLVKISTGLFKHVTRKTVFALCVDDFGVKFLNNEDADHLIATLKQYHNISINWDGCKYCGLTFEWSYDGKYVDVSVPLYVPQELTKYQHPPP